MKKTMLFVSAVVVMAMSAMFVACSNNNAPVNGCTCTLSYQGQTETQSITLAEMQENGWKTCGDIVAAFNQEAAGSGVSMTCKGY